MRKNNIILGFLFFVLLTIAMIETQAQTGLNFQGVARTSNNVILASQVISIKLSILQGSATGIVDYTEIRKVNTNAQGLFNVVIGDTGAISTLGNFNTINWNKAPKFLKIEMDPTAGNNFITMGTTQFQYVAYAKFAETVFAESITGIVPVARGGTGANSLSTFKTAIDLDKVNNTADMDKPISSFTQKAIDLKLNSSDTIKYAKQVFIDSALNSKLSKTDNAATATLANTAATATTATKLATARKINGVDFDGSADITITSIADAGTLTGTTLKSSVTNSSLTSVGTLGNLTVSNPIVGSITGNAATAAKLATARKINGVDFDGSADITITSIADAGTLTGTTLKSSVTNSSLTSVGTLGNLTVSNPIVGSITGNAATATKLATARKVNGVDFDGSADINIDRLTAGDEFGGGIVFYTWANGKHGLIAAMDDLNIDGTNAWNWSGLTNVNTMAKSDGIGAGYKNMLLILSSQGLEADPYAASVCNEFKVDLGSVDRGNLVYPNDVYLSDWYLPSIYELKLIDDFALQYAGNDPNPNWGWWTGSRGYWSSTEFDAASAFYLGYQCSNGCITTSSSVTKTTLGHVRPIRMF